MDTSLIKRAYNLGLKAVPNFTALSEQQVEYYEERLDELPRAIARSFVLPGKKIVPAPMPTMFKASDTNLDQAIALAEKFSAKVLGNSVDLRKLFNIPMELPWKSVMAIFDICLTNREAVKRALKGQGLDVYEETDVMNYSGSKKEKEPTLCIVENSLTPTEDTMGKSPDKLNADGRTYLTLRGYALAVGQRFFQSKDYLDPKTWTWFPKSRLPYGEVAYGYWHPDYGRVWFNWNNQDYRNDNNGARLEISTH